MIAQLVPSSPSSSGNMSRDLSDLESGRALFLTPLTKQIHRPERVQLIHDEDSQYSKSTREEFLQDIAI